MGNQDSDSEMSIDKELPVQTPLFDDQNLEIQNNTQILPQNSPENNEDCEMKNSDSSSNLSEDLNLFESYLQKEKEKGGEIEEVKEQDISN